MRTMVWKMVEGIHVAVHSSEIPTDEDWDAYIQDIAKNLPEMIGLIVDPHPSGGNLTTNQRKAISRFWKAQSKTVPLAVVTPTKLTKILVTAFTWMMGERIRAFLTVNEALEHLQFDPGRRRQVETAVEEMRAAMGRTTS